MKKIILSIITLTFSAFASAQMKVYNNGKVTIGLESQDSESQFSVGSTNTYSLFPVILETRTRGITGSVGEKAKETFEQRNAKRSRLRG